MTVGENKLRRRRVKFQQTSDKDEIDVEYHDIPIEESLKKSVQVTDLSEDISSLPGTATHEIVNDRDSELADIEIPIPLNEAVDLTVPVINLALPQDEHNYTIVSVPPCTSLSQQ